MQDAWRAYLELALGVTEASKKKAQKVAQKLVGKGGATAAQLQALTEDVLSAGATNRDALSKMVRTEVERALSRVGLVSADEVAALTARVRELEEELREAKARAAAAEATSDSRTGPGSEDTLSTGAGVAAPATNAVTTNNTVAKKTVAKKTVAKKAVAKKAVAKEAVAKKTAAPKAVVKKTAAKKTEPAPAAQASAQLSAEAPAPAAAPVKRARATKKAVKKAGGTP